jgi:putative transposase
MPRQPRLDAPGTLHHVMGRGIERVQIFRNRVDRQDFVDRLGEICQSGALVCYAWALMPNHFHLLVRTGNRSISLSMRKLLTGYVVNFNRRHHRYGHLFQNRYKSIVCEDDPYLFELTRYIHLNPLRAGLVKDLAALAGYPWAGHAALMGRAGYPWQATETVLGYFGRTEKEARRHYEIFVGDGVAQGRRPELVGGGLIRSVGGWSQVLSLRRKGTRVASDDRVLGSGEFIESLLQDVESRERETLRLRGRIKDLNDLARDVCEKEGLSEGELRSGSRVKKVTRARGLFCGLAVKGMGYAGAEVARFLGVTTSAVNRAARLEPGLEAKSDQ